MFYDNEEELSCDEETDDGLGDDIEALSRACMLTGTNINDLKGTYDGGTDIDSLSVEEEADRHSSGGEEDDLELFRRVQSRFSKSNDSSEPLSLKPLCAIHPDFDNEDDDFQTLCAVRRRFSAYDASDNARRTMEKTSVENSEGVDGESAVSELDILNGSSTGRKNCKVFPDTEDTLLSDNMEIVPSSSIEQHQQDAFELPSLGMRSFSSFPKSAQLFIDAIKKNRSCQKFLQSKLAQIEARMEENKKLKERVKILKDFQASCRKITGRALGLGKHLHLRLISTRKTEDSRDMEVNGKKVSAMCYGPVENSHVAKYREALENFPVLLKQKKWTEAEKENLKKGIRQQFQEMVLQHSVDQFSGSECSPSDANNLDAILASIRDLEITPERCREFLPKVDWDRLASLYVAGHTGAECEARWLNIEDPLINHSEWTVEEDKKLLFIVQEKGMTNWFDIAVLHGKNRTPFQCLARFQRSLNAHIIRREWTNVEDAQLRIAVETFGENDWQSVASALEGRTGPQCSNRWHKSLHPAISRVGRWTPEESIRLKVAVMLFGPKNWRKIAQFVPGRTHVKCRERWFNCVDPSLKMDKWTEDEDLRLKAAIQEHGYCWAKVAKCLTPRTDSQCLRRWKVLFPQEVPLLQAVRRTQKAAIISNFVDRESDRPTLGPHDFVPSPFIRSASELENTNQSRKRKRKAREGITLGKDKNAAPSNTSKRPRSERLKERMQISSSQHPRKTNWAEAENSGGNDAAMVKKRTKPSSGKNFPTEHDQDDLSSNFLLPRVTGRKFVDTRKKKKLPVSRKTNGGDAALNERRIKPCSRKDSPAECDQNDPLSNVLLPSTTNSIIVYTRRKKKPSGDPNKSIQMEVDGNSQIQPELLPVATELVDDHLYSNILAGNGGGHDAVGQFDASRKINKLPFKRKVHMELADNVKGLMLPVESSELRGTNTEYGNCSSNGVTLSKVNKSPKCSRKSSSVTFEEDRGVEFVHDRPDEHKKTTVRSKSCTKQVLDPNYSDVKPASFLGYKSQERSRQVPENDNQASFYSNRNMGSEVSEKICQHDEGDEMTSVMQDGEIGDYNDNVFAENDVVSPATDDTHAIGVGTKEPCVEDRVLVNSRTDDTRGRREQMGKTDDVDLDVSLASLLHKKQRERRETNL